MRVGRAHIQPQSCLVQGSRQRRDEAALQITIKAFHFAFSAGSVGSAGASNKTIILRHSQQLSIPPVTAFTVSIALDHDGLGIVEQNLLRDSAEVLAGLFDAT